MWTRTKWILTLLLLANLRQSAAAQQAPTPASAPAAYAGTVDVHLGDPKFLAANQFAIEPRDLLRIVGEAVAYGAGGQFVARFLQNGTRALVLRRVRGFPLSYDVPRSNLNLEPQGGVL
jgi:hypothetical protein